jgi:hypothetical protein
MRSLAQLILLVTLTSSLAEQLGLVRSSTRMLKGSKSVKGAANSNQRRQLKGKGSSKGSSSDSECDSTRVFYWTKDLKKHSSEIEGSGGGNSTLGYTIDELPIYYIGQKKAGFLTEANIVTGDDCSYTGVFSFEPNDNGRSMNQIFYQGKFVVFSLRIVPVNLMPLPLLTYVSLLVTHRVVLVCHLERGHRRHWQIRLCLRDRQGIQKSKDARHP